MSLADEIKQFAVPIPNSTFFRSVYDAIYWFFLHFSHDHDNNSINSISQWMDLEQLPHIKTYCMYTVSLIAL